METYLMIMDHLSYSDIMRCKSTCQYLFHTMGQFSYYRLLKIENSERSILGWYACGRCHRLRPSYRFTDDQFRLQDVSTPRHCIGCGLKDGLEGYKVGYPVTIGGSKRVICVCCGQVERSGGDALSRGYCFPCWESYKQRCNAEDARLIDMSNRLADQKPGECCESDRVLQARVGHTRTL